MQNMEEELKEREILRRNQIDILEMRNSAREIQSHLNIQMKKKKKNERSVDKHARPLGHRRPDL
jgi:hypothetical protein